MSLCNCIDRGLTNGCAALGAGVLELLIACKSDVVTSAITYDTLDEYVTAIPVTPASGYTSGAFHRVEVPFESSMFSSPLTVSKQNFNYSFNPTVTFKMVSLEPDVIKIFEALAKAKVIVIAKLHGDKYYLLGKDGLIAESGELNTGTALGDFKGATLTLSSFGESKSVREINTSLVTISSLIATV